MNALPKLPLLSSALRSEELTLEEYLAFLEERFDRIEPHIKAFLSEPDRFVRLKKRAQELKAEFPEPSSRPPLYGVSVAVKDIFHVSGFETRAGSKLPARIFQGREAASVSLLKAAGALILGKSVTTEFAYFGPGPTRNPHHLGHTPGGSSSGSAAAVSAGLCPIALGSQTIGSICRPASFCGVVGYKPSYDRISRAGVIALSPSLDHVGILADSVDGAEMAAGVLCLDWQLAVPERLPVLGLPVGPYLQHAGPDAMAVLRRASRTLSTAGYRIVQVPVMPDFDQIMVRHNLILAAEAAQVHATWHADYGHLYHPQSAELIERGEQISVGELASALAERMRFRRSMLSSMDSEGIDIWLCPAAPGEAPEGLESTGDPIMNLPWTQGGFPVVTLPAGKGPDGLPIGLQFVGKWYEDEALLEWTAKIESLFEEHLDLPQASANFNPVEQVQ